MTTYSADLLREVKDYLQTGGEIKPSKSLPVGAYSLFNLPPTPKNDYDEVYPGIVLGNYVLARKREELKSLGITHIVNMCMGSKFNMIDTHADYFKEVDIKFAGFPAKDVFMYNLSQHFDAAVEFIETALAENGKIYIHCQQGMSRSATVVMAFLMMKRNMNLMDALQAVRAKRAIFPNDGFLKQLCELNKTLYENKS